MCLVGNPDELRKKKAYLLPLVERLGTLQGALSMTNNRGEDALYLMAMNCPQMAYITGYLATTMLQKGIQIGEKLYQPRVRKINPIKLIFKKQYVFLISLIEDDLLKF